MYDVFISFKKTDEYGGETRDSRIARELYDHLTAMGLQVFYSEKTLESIGSSSYKNDIDNALDQVKTMIVVLTDPAHAQSHWVQYEWDGFYNDYLSGIKPDAKLFTLVDGVDIHSLPRTLRNVQSLDYRQGWSAVLQYLRPALPVRTPKSAPAAAEGNERYALVVGAEVTAADIAQALELDRMVYPEEYWLEDEVCRSWYEVNPDIYVMVRDNTTGRIIAYINVSPVTDECYEEIRRGKFIDTGITADMILSYNMPFPYSVYFSSVVIHPQYQNSAVLMKLFNAIIERFLSLGEQEVFIRRMIADAVSKEGEKFCKLFGMSKVDETDHRSTLYEVSMIPPKFRIASKMTKRLHDFYMEKYEEEPYLFD